MRQFVLVIIFISYAVLYSQPDVIKIQPENLLMIAEKYDVDPYKLKAVFYDYLFLTEKNILLKKQRVLLKELPVYAQLAYENGEINDLEKDKLILENLQLENMINSCTYDISIAENKIKQLLNENAAIIPGVDSLERYNSFKLLECIQQHLTTIPDSISSDFINKENLILEFKKYNDQVKFYKEKILPYASKIEKNALLKLENEEIDKISYYYMLKDVYKMEKDYLFLLNQLNQTAILIEKLNENN